ncbi:uncharacterized protein LOC134222896 [Armigeres subalbatus]|uniref:uncharacterized protein LOC134222896 n=1 Tax=Armigeres subalbatus TaxID=124917 RepID=UPI002ED3E264
MIFGDLVFCVHFVVLFQSCCTVVAVSGRTPSTLTAATTTTATTTAAAAKSGNGTAQLIKAAKPNSPNSKPVRRGPASAKQKFDLPAELGQYCAAVEDCRQYAYTCDSQKHSCDCAEGYQADEEGKSCVGAIGKRCNYDIHCIPNAYCKGQMICTCKREFAYLAPDNWSCQASAATSLHRRKSTATTMVMLLATALSLSGWSIHYSTSTR